MSSSDSSNVNNVLSPKVPCYGSDNFGCDQNDCSEFLQPLRLLSKDLSRERNSYRGRRTTLRRFSAELRMNRSKEKDLEQAKVSINDVASDRCSALEMDQETGSEDCRPKKKSYSDDLFISRHPSYTIKNVDYALECEFVYMQAKKKYNAQLRREMENFIEQRPRISEQFITRRLFAYSTLWPPLHTKEELDYFIANFFQLSPKQKSRLNYLMTTDIV
ncbi:PREDICTED: uncharacterized protein LOC108610402 [Drosophila arizonae]|uniref:Uncharacterized protein LOC108610402 n=1 Tax=Drosophila arizonae TaxID=7263 RepID=A0ABM1NSS9_DROAR|nr:PREDICTED: uncharacterized protein LOC108610402 [Drosophila arizonae]